MLGMNDFCCFVCAQKDIRILLRSTTAQYIHDNHKNDSYKGTLCLRRDAETLFQLFFPYTEPRVA